MESWILQVTLGSTYFARDPKDSWFHEHFKDLFLKKTKTSEFYQEIPQSSDLQINQSMGRKLVNTFLFIRLNICFWC